MAEKKGRGKIAAKVEEFIRGPIEEEGYLLWDVDFYKEGTEYNLLVTIEHPNRDHSVDLEDCEKISHRIGPILDEADPIEQSYYLEVSSAGLERELVREEHFRYYLGTEVSIRLYAPLEGKKNFVGTLQSYDEGKITLLLPDGETKVFGKDAVAKVTTVDESL